MQLAATTIDRVTHDRARIVAELVGYAGTDLICYRATEPPSLVEREAQAWDPLLDWLRRMPGTPRQTFVVHGEPDAAEDVRERVRIPPTTSRLAARFALAGLIEIRQSRH